RLHRCRRRVFSAPQRRRSHQPAPEVRSRNRKRVKRPNGYFPDGWLAGSAGQRHETWCRDAAAVRHANGHWRPGRVGMGWLSVVVVNRIKLVASGLYPIMVGTFGLLAFGIAANLGGSGFLAIFIAGVIIGNHRMVFQRSTYLFHDGMARLSQITMFVLLGL